MYLNIMHKFALHLTRKPMLYPNEYVKGILKTLVLKLLKDNNEMYGYEISKAIKEQTLGKIELTEGAMYPLLFKLEANGQVQIREEKIGKRIRKYYSLTPSGLDFTNKQLDSLKDFIETVEQFISVPPKTAPNHGWA